MTLQYSQNSPVMDRSGLSGKSKCVRISRTLISEEIQKTKSVTMMLTVCNTPMCVGFPKEVHLVVCIPAHVRLIF